MGWTGPGQGPVAGSCGHSDKSLGSIKDRQFTEMLNNYQLLKEDSSPWS
jgi:hypothetical protein